MEYTTSLAGDYWFAFYAKIDGDGQPLYTGTHGKYPYEIRNIVLWRTDKFGKVVGMVVSPSVGNHMLVVANEIPHFLSYACVKDWSGRNYDNMEKVALSYLRELPRKIKSEASSRE